ncbi:phosphoenolpyruvate synthase [Candidatus Woesearchaeota archaeon]|nr:phosphoenolpyruvate synthase [Candidatus Woesearchaeota archaeon]
MNNKKEFIIWFKDLTIEDVPLVGGKNASLGEMYRNLTKKGVSVPNGFAVTAYAYRYLLKQAKVEKQIREILSDLDTHDMHNLSERGRKVREIILEAEIPKELKNAIIGSYHKLCKEDGHDIDVAVRSSATAEDLPDASFAGQQETYLNIKGEHALLEACKKCFASLFTNRAISYRVDKGFDHFQIALSIGIQKMVRSDLASSGVMFSIDTETGFKDAVLVTGAYGLGENIVRGTVNPDQFYVFKPTLKKGFKPIISKKLGAKQIKMIYDNSGEKHTTRNVEVSEAYRNKFCINDLEILKLAEWAVIIEEHYSKKANKFKPMDIEWAKDGKTGKLFIVQARPETVQSQKDVNILEEYVLKEKGNVLITGLSIGSKIGQGKAHVIRNVKDISEFKQNEVLVTEMTDPDWEPVMKSASAIVTNRGGKTCHAAIIARELGIPCVVGTGFGTEKIKNNGNVTVSCAEGSQGYVYEGLLKYNIKKTDLKKLKKPKTKIMMNVGNPEQAFELSFIPNEGIGLARQEFIISSYIKVHPLALLHFDSIHEHSIKNDILHVLKGYKNDKAKFFIDKLAEGAATIAAAFYPKDVIIRLSDFKSNEYANLIGGKLFEPVEDNPMLGWRGASRYYSEKYNEAFALECKALKKVRDIMGLTNIKIMVPFCRTVEEGKKVINEMEKHGLKQGKNNLEVYVMCEIPSNVVLADEFAKIFDGFSIGTNDLTQLTLGLDRDSELVSHIYDENNEAVRRLVAQVIKIAKKNKRKIGICGDAPSSSHEFARFLVECGIDSMSLTPDAVIKTILIVNEEEKKLRGH